MVKGLAAGSSNLLLALALGAKWPAASLVLDAMLLGFFSYGISLVLFVRGLRALGTARTGAYFSVAPFFGALLSVLAAGEAVTWPLLAVAALLMAAGVWLHLSERRERLHAHEAMDHAHEHVHGQGDEHRDHVHVPPVPPGTRHSHPHQHEPLVHAHPHYRMRTTVTATSVETPRGGNAMPRRCRTARSRSGQIRDDAVDAPADQLVHQRADRSRSRAGPAGPARTRLFDRAPA